MKKELSHVMLELHNVRMKLSDVRRSEEHTSELQSPNTTKELSHVILELHNMRMKLSNVRKKVREQPNVIKELSYVTKIE